MLGRSSPAPPLGSLCIPQNGFLPSRKVEQKSTSLMHAREVGELWSALAETFKVVTKQGTKLKRSLGFCRAIAYN